MHVTTAASMRTLVFTYFISTLSHSRLCFPIFPFNTLHAFLRRRAQLARPNTAAPSFPQLNKTCQLLKTAILEGQFFTPCYGSSLPFSFCREFGCWLQRGFPPTRQKHSVTLRLWYLESTQKKEHAQDSLFALHYSIDTPPLCWNPRHILHPIHHISQASNITNRNRTLTFRTQWHFCWVQTLDKNITLTWVFLVLCRGAGKDAEQKQEILTWKFMFFSLLQEHRLGAAEREGENPNLEGFHFAEMYLWSIPVTGKLNHYWRSWERKYFTLFVFSENSCSLCF